MYLYYTTYNRGTSSLELTMKKLLMQKVQASLI